MTQLITEQLKSTIREIPDFPEPGILFRDITPILSNGELFRHTIAIFSERYHTQQLQKIVAIDARGFILGAAVANALGIGFIPVRKRGKLPAKTLSESYQLEYGNNTLEIHEDSILPGERIAILDDVLATGGTAAATANLVEKLGGKITEISFLIELLSLKGREKLPSLPIFSAIQYA